MIEPFLEQNNIKIGRDRLFALLAEQGLLMKKHKRRVRTTMSFHRFYKWPNLINEYIPKRPMELFVSDITYWKINTSHLYISLITDAYSHKIVGYNLANTLEAIESKKALEQSLSGLTRDQTSRLIHHSDRGIQYCSNEYVKLLQDNCIQISMTQGGDPRDNAVAERVNGILKNEYLVHYKINTLQEAQMALAKAVHLYNNERPHLSVDYMTPEHVHSTSCNTRKRWTNYYKKEKV